MRQPQPALVRSPNSWCKLLWKGKKKKKKLFHVGTIAVTFTFKCKSTEPSYFSLQLQYLDTYKDTMFTWLPMWRNLFFHVLQHVLRTKTLHLRVPVPQALRVGVSLHSATWIFTFLQFRTHPQFPNDVVSAIGRTGEFQVAPVWVEKVEEWWNASPRTQGVIFFLPFPNKYKSSHSQSDVDLSAPS